MRCASCKQEKEPEARRVRGILCEPCNGFLGAFDDDPQIIASAIEYLERHQ